MKTRLHATNIQWETDGQKVTLPKSVCIPDHVALEYQLSEENDEVLSDYLSDEYGFLHNGFDIEMK